MANSEDADMMRDAALLAAALIGAAGRPFTQKEAAALYRDMQHAIGGGSDYAARKAWAESGRGDERVR